MDPWTASTALFHKLFNYGAIKSCNLRGRGLGAFHGSGRKDFEEKLIQIELSRTLTNDRVVFIIMLQNERGVRTRL